MNKKTDIQNIQAIAHDEIVYEMAELFKVCGDYTRIQILFSLFDTERCVGDIASMLNMTHSSISHQLRVLKQARLVRFRRSGREILYSMADDHIKTLFAQAMEHVLE